MKQDDMKIQTGGQAIQDDELELVTGGETLPNKYQKSRPGFGMNILYKKESDVPASPHVYYYGCYGCGTRGYSSRIIIECPSCNSKDPDIFRRTEIK